MTRKVLTDGQQGLVFTRRAMFLGGAQAAMGLVLAGRMGWLAVAENARYSGLAEENRVQSVLVLPRRGWIIDRQGQPIAINRPDLRIDLIPDKVANAEREVAILARLLQLQPDEVDRIHEDLSKAAGFRPVQVASGLDWDRYAAVNLAIAELPGALPSRGYARHYPAGASVGHLVGYVGAASAKDFEKDPNPLLVAPGFKIGKEGLEKTMEPVMRGRAGARRTEVTARGRLVRELTTRPEVPGRNLRLTIDAGLQDYVARRLGDQSGSVVVLDLEQGGDILAMASMPCYDPNSFSDGIGVQEWAMLSADDHLPLVNKTMQGLYPPGSTVKPMNALALLAAGVDPAETVSCSGAYRVGRGVFHCWRRRGHGPVDMRRAIAQSCDVYFYAMIRRLGIERLAEMARKLGLGQEFPLPVTSQRYGTMPDAEWKLRKYKQPWTVSDTVNASIGQGYVLANPMQLAVMAARIGSGLDIVPRLVRRTTDRAPGSLGIPAEHLAIVHRAMADVVSGAGTAGQSRLRIPGVEMAGKTGSAQVRRITMAERRSGVLSNEALAWRLRDHGHFIAFAPFDRPRYACAVVLEHGGHGADAGRVARDAITYLYDRPQAMTTLEANEKQWGGTVAERMAAKSARWAEAQAAAASPGPATTPAASPKAPPPATPRGETPPAPEPVSTPQAAEIVPPSPDVPR